MQARRFPWILICVLLPSSFVTSAGRAGTYGVPVPYPTIQAAIHAASSGDTVLVAPGTYTGTGNRAIDMEGKDVVVRSRDGAAATTIDCEAAGRAFHIFRGETNAAAIEGFTILRGFVDSDQNGGGILCEQASPTIRDCVIRQCMVGGTYDGDGGGINCRDSSTRIERCTIFSNYAVYGGGIACRGSLPITITDCTVTENTATNGGGIDAGGIGAPSITRCVVSGNTATGWAGGILLGGSTLVTDCTITGNLGSMGGGVANAMGTSSIVGCTLSGNFAQSGGGVFAAGTTTIERSILWGDCAETLGNEIDAYVGGSVSLTCCIIDPQQTAQDGGTITFGPNNVNADPLFCSSLPCSSAPTTQGTYTVDRRSPAYPDQNPCGEWIGSRRVGCPPADVDAPLQGKDLAMLGAPMPNPAREQAACVIRLPRPAEVTLRLVDPAGRIVRTLFAGTLPAGESQIPIRLAGSDGRSLPSGAYAIHLAAAGRTEARSLILIR